MLMHTRWYLLTMGTGITSILLHQLPYQFNGLQYISVVIFVLNIVLYTIITIITALRYILYPHTLKLMLQHPTQSLFLGAAPMGLATIINMIVYVLVPTWGPWTVELAWILWWIDVVLAIFICYGIPVLA